MILQSFYIVSSKDFEVWDKYVFKYLVRKGVYNNFY